MAERATRTGKAKRQPKARQGQRSRYKTFALTERRRTLLTIIAAHTNKTLSYVIVDGIDLLIEDAQRRGFLDGQDAGAETAPVNTPG